MKLKSGNDVWTVTLLGENKVSIYNRILSGTYSDVSEYDLVYDKENDEWKSNEGIYIKKPQDCVPYKMESLGEDP